ncbi:hypothetical protein BLJAPNOD_05743 [Ensifer sp. M14]|nr:hypothetical protein BLJAPNOD_05743 [Ensifer sp. M14]
MDDDLRVPTLTVIDMFAQKLLANADRYYDKAVAYRVARLDGVSPRLIPSGDLRRGATLPVLPRVYDRQAYTLEVRNIPSCQCGTTGKRDGGDLSIELADWATCLAPLSCN